MFTGIVECIHALVVCGGERGSIGKGDCCIKQILQCASSTNRRQQGYHGSLRRYSTPPVSRFDKESARSSNEIQSYLDPVRSLSAAQALRVSTNFVCFCFTHIRITVCTLC